MNMAVMNIVLDMPTGISETEVSLVASLSTEDRYKGLLVNSNLLPFLTKNKMIDTENLPRRSNMLIINGLTEQGLELATLISYNKL